MVCCCLFCGFPPFLNDLKKDELKRNGNSYPIPKRLPGVSVVRYSCDSTKTGMVPGTLLDSKFVFQASLPAGPISYLLC